MVSDKGYIPPQVYYFLYKLANQHNLSIKEVEIALLREIGRELGFECKHQNIGFAKSNGLPFCRDCFTRMEQVEAPVFKGKVMTYGGRYKPLPSFLEVEKHLR